MLKLGWSELPWKLPELPKQAASCQSRGRLMKMKMNGMMPAGGEALAVLGGARFCGALFMAQMAF